MEVFPLAQEMGLVVKGVEINFFLNALFTLFIYLFIFGCVVFVSVRGLSLVVASGGHTYRGVRASHYRDLSCCGAQAPDTQAQ